MWWTFSEHSLYCWSYKLALLSSIALSVMMAQERKTSTRFYNVRVNQYIKGLSPFIADWLKAKETLEFLLPEINNVTHNTRCQLDLNHLSVLLIIVLKLFGQSLHHQSVTCCLLKNCIRFKQDLIIQNRVRSIQSGIQPSLFRFLHPSKTDPQLALL